jgi:hypothetical protein
MAHEYPFKPPDGWTRTALEPETVFLVQKVHG